MSKEKGLQLSGTVIDLLPNTKFIVKLENDLEITCYLSGKLRQNKISIITGDTVTVEISPYDLTQGRIVWRNK